MSRHSAGLSVTSTHGDGGDDNGFADSFADASQQEMTAGIRGKSGPFIPCITGRKKRTQIKHKKDSSQNAKPARRAGPLNFSAFITMLIKTVSSSVTHGNRVHMVGCQKASIPEPFQETQDSAWQTGGA